MTDIIVVPLTADFPQDNQNRARSAMLDEILDHVGSGDRQAARNLAARSLDSSVREYNTVAWRFNRMQQDITFLVNTSDYSLNATFRSPLRGRLLDENTQPVDWLEFKRFEDETKVYPSRQSTSSFPSRYWIRNVHETGQVTFDPRIGDTLSTVRPAARIDYHRRIVLASADASVLNVPIEIEEGIVQLATAKVVAKTRSFQEAALARGLADKTKRDLEWEWRDWPDSASHME